MKAKPAPKKPEVYLIDGVVVSEEEWLAWIEEKR